MCNPNGRSGSSKLIESSSSIPDSIHVSLASDQGYMPGMTIAAASLALYASPETSLVFHILDGGLNEDSFLRFGQTLRNLHPKSSVLRYPVNGGMFDKYPIWHGSRMTYARLLLPDLLPHVERILYIDCDILWLAPVEELWNTPFDGALAMACRDESNPKMTHSEATRLADMGFPMAVDDYFNAGVIILNLELMRTESVVAQLFDFLNQNQSAAMLVDQTALNAIMHGRVRFLDRKWNVFFPKTGAQDFSDNLVVHYTNACPWLRQAARVVHDNRIYLWHAFRRAISLNQKKYSVLDYFPWWVAAHKRVLAILAQNPYSGSLACWMLNKMAGGRLPADFREGVRALSSKRLKHFKQEWKGLISAKAVTSNSCPVQDLA